MVQAVNSQPALCQFMAWFAFHYSQAVSSSVCLMPDGFLTILFFRTSSLQKTFPTVFTRIDLLAGGGQDGERCVSGSGKQVTDTGQPCTASSLLHPPRGAALPSGTLLGWLSQWAFRSGSPLPQQNMWCQKQKLQPARALPFIPALKNSGAAGSPQERFFCATLWSLVVCLTVRVGATIHVCTGEPVPDLLSGASERWEAGELEGNR